MDFARKYGRAPVAAAFCIFISVISTLAQGCHQSLDLLIDSSDAAVTLVPDGATSDARPPVSTRVPPDPCTADTDCEVYRGVCSTSKGICVECKVDGDCPPQRSTCEVASGQCVGCLGAQDCPQNGWTCDVQTRECARLCSFDGECQQSPFSLFPICSSSRQVCVMCETDADCSRFSFFAAALSGAALFCRAGQCAECAQDLPCPSSRPYCDSRFGICDECRTAGDCQTGQSCLPTFPAEFLRRCQ
jgi:hypothetical protein